MDGPEGHLTTNILSPDYITGGFAGPYYYWNKTEDKKPRDGEVCAVCNEFGHGLDDAGIKIFKTEDGLFEGWDGSRYYWYYWIALPDFPAAS